MKALRAAKQLNQRELAQASGVTQRSIARYETGETVMSLEAAAKIADALGCSIGVLAGRDEQHLNEPILYRHFNLP